MDPCRLTLLEAARRLRDGTLGAEDHARALLARCDRDAALNAFVSLDAERLLADARAADHHLRHKGPPGPLHGIPIAIKDNIDVAGLPTTAGTPSLAADVVRYSAPVVQRLFDAGAILLGKTCLFELAFGITSSNEWTGATRNPWNPEKSAGGSSGGSAVAVASGMAPAALGTDTAGSVRIPAAHCGIFGFRPSTGRYPDGGIVPLFHSRDTAGFLARSAADIALLDAVVSGESALPATRLRGLRIGVAGDAYFDCLDNRVAAVIEQELRRLSASGVTLVAADPPDFGDELIEVTGVIRSWELRRDIGRYLADTGAPVDFDGLIAGIAGAYVRDDIEAGLGAHDTRDLERRYRDVVDRVLPRHLKAYRRFLLGQNLAAIAFPTTPLAPTPIDANHGVVVDGRPTSIWDTLRNTVPATLRRAPAISLPAGLSADGLPVGLELDGAPDADRSLLAIACAWERQHPGTPLTASPRRPLA